MTVQKGHATGASLESWDRVRATWSFQPGSSDDTPEVASQVWWYGNRPLTHRSRVAILAGEANASQLAAAASSLANFDQILFLEPEPVFRAAADIHQWLTPDVERILQKSRFAVVTDGGGYSRCAYLSIVRFLLDQPAALRLVFYGCRPASASPLRQAHLLAVLRDMRYCLSDAFLAQPQEPDAETAGLLWRWLEALAGYQPLHALKFLYRFRRHWPAQAVESKIMHLLLELEKPRILRPMVPGNLRNNPGVADMLRELDAGIAAQRQETTVRRQRNLAYLAKWSPAAAQAAEDYPGEDGLECSPVADTGLIFYRFDGNTIRQLSIGLEYENIIAIMKRPGTSFQDSHVLIDTLVQANILCLQKFLQLTPPVSNWVYYYYYVEPDARLFSAFISAFDIEAYRGQAELVFFVGPQWQKQLTNYFTSGTCRHPPASVFASRPEVCQALKHADNVLKQNCLRLVTAVREQYSSYSTSDLLQALENRPARPLRVLFLTSIFTTVLQHVTRDLAAGFTSLGCVVKCVREEETGGSLRNDARWGEVHRFKPDLIVMLDHTRFDCGFAGLPACIPVATWVQDFLPWLHDENLIRSLGKNDFAFVLLPEWVPQFQKLGYPHVSFLPLAVDGDLYFPAAEPHATIDAVAFPCRISVPVPPTGLPQLFAHFQTHLVKASTNQERYDCWENYFAGEFQRLYPQATPELQMVAKSAGAEWSRFQERLTWVRGALAAGLPLRLYGAGWELFPETASHALGEISQGLPLRNVYQQHRGVLNVGMVLHMRVIETLASGGLPVVQYEPQDTDDLIPGVDFAVFRDMADLVAVTRRLLTDETWRQSLIAAGSAKVRARYTYRARAKTIINDIRTRILQRPAVTTPAKSATTGESMP